jgi:hypothetical protein
MKVRCCGGTLNRYIGSRLTILALERVEGIDVFDRDANFTPLSEIIAKCVANNWRDDRCVVPNLRWAPPIPLTSVYVYVRDGTAPVPPEFTIAKYSSRPGMANRMIASRGQPELDSP